jgi:hypothetical protein
MATEELVVPAQAEKDARNNGRLASTCFFTPGTEQRGEAVNGTRAVTREREGRVLKTDSFGLCKEFHPLNLAFEQR